MKTQDWIVLGVGLWGAVLSTLLAARQVVRERRRLKVMVRTLGRYEMAPSGKHQFWEVLEVRAHNGGMRPVYVPSCKQGS